jgi:phosphatidate cytidylyltransferase
MLKQRILTAIALIPPLLAALYLLPTTGIVILFGVFIGAGAWEWGGLCGLTRMARAGYVGAVLVIGAGATVASLSSRGFGEVVFALAGVWWLAALFVLGWTSGGVFFGNRGKLVTGVLTLAPAWAALGVLHASDPRRPLLLLFVIVMVAVADTGAYAAGHAFGRTKLAPSISPGKTVEGVVGGAVGVMLLAYFCGTMLWHFEGRRLATWVGLAALAGLISVVGDLSESKLKRAAGVKDSGNLLPGHGGVLDRIDALTAAAPVFAWGWLVLFDSRA